MPIDSRADAYSPEMILAKMRDLRYAAARKEQLGSDSNRERTNYEYYSNLYTLKTGNPPIPWERQISKTVANNWIPEWDPAISSEHNRPIFGLDFETSVIHGSRIPVPLEFGMQQFSFNPEMSSFSAVGDPMRGLIWPTNPMGERVPISEIDRMLNEFIPERNQTLGQLTGLNIGMWKNPQAHGYPQVYTPAQVGAALHSKFTQTGRAPVVLGHNVKEFDVPKVLNRMLSVAGYPTLQKMSGSVIDTYQMAIQAGIPKGHRSLSAIADQLALTLPATMHSGLTDVNLSAQIYPSFFPQSGTRIQGNAPMSNQPPPNNPNSPFAQATPNPGRGFNPYSKQSMDLFETTIQGLEGQLPGINIRTHSMGDRLRVSFAPSQQFRGKPADPLILDLAPGYQTPFGYSMELVSESGWRGMFAPEMIVNDPTKASGMELRAPIDAFAQYVRETFAQSTVIKHAGSNPRERFFSFLSLGSQYQGRDAQGQPAPHTVAGGFTWYGPVHSEFLKARGAARVNVSLAPGIRNHDEVYDAIRNMTLTSRQSVMGGSANPNELAWSRMYGYMLAKDENERLRAVSPTLGLQEGDQVIGMGKSVDKILGGMKIRDREQAVLHQFNAATGRVSIAMPREISPTSREAQGRSGFRMLAGSLPGEEERYIGQVVPNVANVKETPLSGALTLYDPNILGDIISAGYPTPYQIELPQLNAYQLKNATWEFGRFKAVDEEGKPTTYQRIGDEANRLPAALDANSRSIVGLLSYLENEGDIEPRQVPIEVPTFSRNLYFPENQQPRLIVPEWVNRTTTVGEPMPPGPGQEQDIIRNPFIKTIQKNFPGVVQQTGMSGMQLILPSSIETAESMKGIYKNTVMFPNLPLQSGSGRFDQSVRVQSGRGSYTRQQIYGVTGGLKSPEYGFALHSLTLTTAQREQLYGEFSAINPDMAAEMQRYAREQAAKRETVTYQGQPIETYGGVSSERLAQIYSQYTGTPYTFQTTAETMYGRLRQIVSALPQGEQLKRYDYVSDLETQYYNYGMVSESEKAMLQKVERISRKAVLQDMGFNTSTPAGRRQLEQAFPGAMQRLSKSYRFQEETNLPAQSQANRFDAMAYARQLRPEDISVEAWENMLSNFGANPPQAPANERQYYFMRKDPAMLMNMVTRPVPEFMGKSVSLGYEELAAINAVYPQATAFMGLNLDDLNQDAQFTPRDKRAWRAFGRAQQYNISEARPKRVPSGVTRITPEMAAAISGSGISDLDELANFIGGDSDMYYLEGIDKMVPSARMVGALATSGFEEGNTERTLLSQWARRYPEVLSSPLQGEILEGSAVQQFLEYAENVYTTKDREAVKAMMSVTAPGDIGRYTGKFGLRLNEMLIPDQTMHNQLIQAARRAGIPVHQKFDDPATGQPRSYIAQAWQAANENVLPQILVREPAYTRVAQMFSGVTESQLEQRGLWSPRSTMVSGGKIFPGNPFTTGWVGAVGLGAMGQFGDYDADLAAILAGYKVDPQSGLMSFSSREYQKMIKMTPAQQVKELLGIQERVMGTTNGIPGGQYNEAVKAGRENIEALVTGRHGREPIPGVSPEQMAQRLPSQWQGEWEELWQQSETALASGTSASGRPYRVAQMVEAAATGLGWEAPQINTMRTSMANFYQRYLDNQYKYYQARKGPHAMESAMSSVYFAATKQGEYRMFGKNSATSNYSTIWKGGFGKGIDRLQTLGISLGHFGVGAVATDIAGMDTPNYQLAASLLATNPEDISGLATRMQGYTTQGLTPEQAIRRTFMGTVETSASYGPEAYYQGKDVTTAPFMAGLITNAIGKTQGFWNIKPRQWEDPESGEKFDVKNVTANQIFSMFGKQNISVGRSGYDPTFQRISEIYGAMTRNLGRPGQYGENLAGMAPPEILSPILAFREQMVASGKQPGFALDWMLGREGAVQASRDLVNAQAQFTAEGLSDEQAYGMFAKRQKFNIGSSVAPYFAGDATTRATLPDYVPENITRFVGQQLFDVEPDLLRSPSERRSFARNIKLGRETEEVKVEEVAEARGMFEYETLPSGKRVRTSGPIYGIEHEKYPWIPIEEVFSEQERQAMLQKSGLPQLPKGINVHGAMDLFGGSTGGAYLGEFKASQARGTAREKPFTEPVINQVTGYNLILQSLASSSGKGWSQYIEPMFGETPWFKETVQALREEKNAQGQSVFTEEQINERKKAMIAASSRRARNPTRLGQLEVGIQSYYGSKMQTDYPTGVSVSADLSPDVRTEQAEIIGAAVGYLGSPSVIKTEMNNLMRVAGGVGLAPADLGPSFFNILQSEKGEEFRAPRSVIGVQRVQNMVGQMVANTPPPPQAPPPTGTGTTGQGPVDEFLPFGRIENGRLIQEQGLGTTTNLGRSIFDFLRQMPMMAPGAQGEGPDNQAIGQMAVNAVFAPGGGLPHRGVMNMRKGLQDIIALQGEGDRLVNYSSDIIGQLAPIAGVSETLARASGFSASMLFAEAIKQNPEQARTWYQTHQRDTNRLAASSATAMTALEAIKKGNFTTASMEERTTLADLNAIGPEERATIGAAVTGGTANQRIADLGRSMREAAEIKKVAVDQQLAQGKAFQTAIDAVKDFATKIGEATVKVNDWQRTIDDTTTSEQKRLELTKRQELELQRTSTAELKTKYAGVQAEMEAIRTYGAEGMDPQKLASTLGAAVSVPRQILRSQEAERKLEGEVAEAEAGTGGGRPESGTGRFFRRALGGFGLMYLQSLVGLATGGMGYGFGQRETLDATLAQSSAGAIGAGVMPRSQTQILQNRIALSGSDYNPMMSLQMAYAQLPGARELGAALQGGIGAYAGLQWYGSFSAPGSTLHNIANEGQWIPFQRGSQRGAGPGINLTSAKIGAVVGGLALAGQVIATQADTEGVAQRLSNTSRGTVPFLTELLSLEGAVGGARYLFGDKEMRETTDQYDRIRSLMAQGGSLRRYTEGMSYGDQAAALNRMSRIAIEQNPAYAPEVSAAVAQTMYRTNIAYSPETFKQLAAQQQFGIANEQTVAGMYSALGFNATQMYQSQGNQPSMVGATMMQLSRQPLSPELRANITSGIQALGSMGPIGYYLPGLGAGGGTPMGPEQMRDYYNRLGEISNTPMFDMYNRQMENWYAAQQLGEQYKQPLLPTGPMSAAEVRATDLTTAMGRVPLQTRLAYQETASQSLFGMATGEDIQMYTERLRGMPLGEQVAEIERMSAIGQIRSLQEKRGEGFTLQDYDTLMSAPRSYVNRRLGITQRYDATTGMLTDLGVSPGEAYVGASVLRRAEEQGPTGMYLANVARNQLPVATAVGLDIDRFTREIVSGNPSQALMSSSIGQRILTSTGNQIQAGQIGNMALTGSQEQANFLQNYFNFNPIAMTQMAQAGAVSNQLATTNITLGGAVTSQPLFTSSMMQGSQNMTAAVLGPLANTQVGRAMQFGININTGQVFTSQAQQQAARREMTASGMDPNQFIQGGQRAASWYQALQGWEQQRTQAGIAGAQIALQEKWQPIFWNIQDRQTALGDRQTEWGFAMQQRQMNLQSQQFYQNMGMQQRQMQMQRGWTVQDWSFQDTQREMQWGWKQEDFQESARFLSGRDRRLAERQMTRETTMYGMDTEQIQRQRARQKETWNLEDERFRLQKRQYEENKQLQEESLKAQRAFYEEGKLLRDEMVEAQRQYWRENIELQKQATGASAKYAETMIEVQKAMMLTGQAQDDYSDRVKIAMMNETKMINTLIEGLNWIIVNAPEKFRGIFDGSGGMIPAFNPGDGGGGGCFIGSTMVATSDGDTPISKVKVGSWVWAYSEHTQEMVLRRVERVFVHPQFVVCEVVTKLARIKCTPKHTFYTKQHGWRSAQNLVEGDQIRTIDGLYTDVVEVLTAGESEDVYNLSVETDHTYFVEDHLVHNMQAKAIGGPFLPGVGIVGEAGMELIESSIPGSVTPNNELKAIKYGQASNFNSYWNNSYINNHNAQPAAAGPQTIIINIGGEQFKKYIIDTIDGSVKD